MQAYYVEAERCGANPTRVRYIAMAGCPDDAVRAVRGIVAPEVALRCTGQTLSGVVAQALGIRPGQARVV